VLAAAKGNSDSSMGKTEAPLKVNIIPTENKAVSDLMSMGPILKI
jgi:hypothetical protein